MTQRVQFDGCLRRRNRRQDKRQRMLKKLANWRAAKERKRQERLAAGWQPEPKLARYFPLEYGVRVKATGETHWHDLRSARQAAKALGLILKHCPNGS